MSRFSPLLLLALVVSLVALLASPAVAMPHDTDVVVPAAVAKPVSLPALDANPALLGADEAAATAGEGEGEGEFVVPELSERTRAILELDHAYEQTLSLNDTQKYVVKGNNLMGTAAYNYATATKLFWHSVSAYCVNGASLSGWTCNSCKQFGAFKVTAVMDDGVNQGYVGYFTQGLPSSPVPGAVAASEPFVVVSFRGTVPHKLSNWIEDLSFGKTAAFSPKYPKVGVHGGFWHAYNRLKSRLLPGLDAALSASKARAIIFTGHSLGGAMAELAALDLKLNHYTNKIFAAYTQGTPRPGNPEFAALFNQQIAASFREIHQADCVTHLPPKLLGFAQAPTEVWFNRGMTKYQVCSATNGEDKSCANSLLLPVSVFDHITYRGISVGTHCAFGGKGDVSTTKMSPFAQEVDRLRNAMTPAELEGVDPTAPLVDPHSNESSSDVEAAQTAKETDEQATLEPVVPAPEIALQAAAKPATRRPRIMLRGR